MLRFLFLCIFASSLLNAATSVDRKITSKNSELNRSKKVKNQTSLKIKTLASTINKQTKELTSLEQNILKVNKDISQHKEMLLISQNKLHNLEKTSNTLKKQKESSQEQIVNVIIENFSSSLAIKLANENSLNELIDSEIYSLLSKNSKDSLLRINNKYMNLSQNKEINEKNITKISTYIKKREKTKNILNALKKKHTYALKSLENKHVAYQKALKTVIHKQKSIQNLLQKLNIVQKSELKKQKSAKLKERKRLAALKKQASKQKSTSSKTLRKRQAQKIDLDVRILGSSTKGVKISKYRGAKTISPLKSFTVVKKFGKYYDPVYKIKLFNESLVMKSKKRKAKVYSILNGKIVYAKKNAGILDNVVIVQHKNGLHTIYSHLDQISPTLKVGKWIKKGYVVGRVDDTLTFQATKNSAHVNPQDLFN